MIIRFRCFLLLGLVGLTAQAGLAAEPAGPAVGPFFEPEQPFFGSQVEVFAPPKLDKPVKGERTGDNFVVRGILLPLPSGYCVLFDQELLRVAAIWRIPAGGTPVTPTTMAQISYENPRRKVGGDR